jgi:hypothetical protein
VDLVKGVTKLMTPSLGLQSPAKILPDNTLFFYSVSDLEGLWGSVTRSKFWETVKQMRFWKDIAFQENLDKALALLKDQIGMELTESRVMDIFGKRFTMAVTLGENSDICVFLQAHVSKKTEFLEATLQNLIERSNNTIQKTIYTDENIFFLPASSPEQPEIRYTLVGDLLTVAFGKADMDIKNCIDLLKNKSASLSKNPNYEASRKFLGDDENYHMLSFMDFTRLASVLPKVIEPFQKAQPQVFANINIEEISKNLQQIKYVCTRGVWGSDGLFNVKTFVVPDLDKMNADQKTQWTQTEKSLQAMDFFPLESLVVNVSGNLNAEQLWKNFTETANSADVNNANPIAEIISAITAWETSSGIRIKEDLIEQMGEEMGFVFNGVNFEGQLPVPRLGIILKAKNASALYTKLTQAIEKLVTDAKSLLPLTLEKKTLHGAEVTALVTPYGEGLSPVIGYLDPWVFIASNEAFAEKLLISKDGQKLSEKETFQKIIPDAHGTASQINFVDIAGIVTMLKNLLNEVLNKNLLLALPNGKELSANISTYVFPILDSLFVFDSFGFSSRKQDSVLVQVVNLQLHDLK